MIISCGKPRKRKGAREIKKQDKERGKPKVRAL